MRTLVAAGLIALLSLGLVGCPPEPVPTELPADQTVPTDGSVEIMSLMIDAEQEDTAGLQKLTDFLLVQQVPTTVYVSADYANRNATLIGDLHAKGFEIALHGFNTGEQLATMTYEDQKDLITRALTAVRGCTPCGTSRPVIGFRPQYFSQNEDTYKVLDELALTYNSGYKAGHLPFTGEEAARRPLLAPGHNFMVLPVTTTVFNGKDIYLCDISCALAEKLTAEDFAALLAQGRAEARTAGEPFVANFHGWYTGDDTQYSYWPVFESFVKKAKAEGAVFVRSRQLATLYSQ
jgi:peptidoglycan/xylan/chitin deacetylase (PgdA/CDA1 family)